MCYADAAMSVRKLLLVLSAAACIAVGACSSSSSTPSGAGAGASDAGAGVETGGDDDAALGDDGAPSGDAADGAADKAASCASTFGSELTNAFGRLDGTVLAIVQPNDQRCAMPNSTHLVLQVTMHGAAYRMVVNVLSESAGTDTRVRYASVEGPSLPGGAWSEGWHTGVTVDYVATLGLHSTSPEFTPIDQAPLAKMVSDAIAIGDHVSVFATSSGGASAHLVHRNDGATDGAIVLQPEAAKPRWLVFHFLEQTF